MRAALETEALNAAARACFAAERRGQGGAAAALRETLLGVRDHQPLRCGASGAGRISSPRVWCACRLYKRQDDLKAVAAQLKEALRKQEAERPPEPEYDSDGNEVMPPEPEPDAAPAVEAEGP